MNCRFIFITTCCLSLVLAGQSTTGAESGNWPLFRGDGTGRLPQPQGFPTEWSDKTLAWRATLEGHGQSSPVAWGDRLFVTSTKGRQKETLLVECFQLKGGHRVWQYAQPASTPSEWSDYTSRAAPTPAVDASRVYAFFEEGDIVALTHDGNMIWKQNLRETFGPFEGNHGLGASLTLTSYGCVVVLDHEGQSWLLSLDKESGAIQWKTERDASSAWASPVTTFIDNQESILLSASRTVRSYDPRTGDLLWEYDGVIGNNVPSVSVSGDWIAVPSNRKGHCRVLRIIEGKPTLVWKSKQASSSFGSPLIHEGRVYFVNKAGIVFCHDLASGELLYDHRLSASTWASPLAVGSRLWFFGQDGETTIMKGGELPEVMASPKLSMPPKDRIYGYAAMRGCIVMRSGNQLFCVTGESSQDVK